MPPDLPDQTSVVSHQTSCDISNEDCQQYDSEILATHDGNIESSGDVKEQALERLFEDDAKETLTSESK